MCKDSVVSSNMGLEGTATLSRLFCINVMVNYARGCVMTDQQRKEIGNEPPIKCRTETG